MLSVAGQHLSFVSRSCVLPSSEEDAADDRHNPVDMGVDRPGEDEQPDRDQRSTEDS